MKAILFIFLLAFLGSVSVIAQHNHGGNKNKNAGHEGELKPAGLGFYIQASYKDGFLHVSLLDENKKLFSSAEKKAKALIKFMGGKQPYAITMIPAPDGTFEYTLDKTIKYDSVDITIEDKEKLFSASFDLMDMNLKKSADNGIQNHNGHHH